MSSDNLILPLGFSLCPRPFGRVFLVCQNTWTKGIAMGVDGLHHLDWGGGQFGIARPLDKQIGLIAVLGQLKPPMQYVRKIVGLVQDIFTFACSAASCVWEFSHAD